MVSNVLLRGLAGGVAAWIPLIAANDARADDGVFGGFVVPGFYGQPSTTYQEWSGFKKVAGPNAPLPGSSDGANAYDASAATDGAFLTGNRIYSFSAPTHPVVTITDAARGPAYQTQLILQVETIGSPPDLSSVLLTSGDGLSAAPSSSTLLKTVDSGSPFGGATNDYQFVWNVPGNAAGYTFSFSASESSMSWAGARVDTLATPTPEPASVGLIGLAGVGLLRRRRRSPRAASRGGGL